MIDDQLMVLIIGPERGAMNGSHNPKHPNGHIHAPRPSSIPRNFSPTYCNLISWLVVDILQVFQPNRPNQLSLLLGIVTYHDTNVLGFVTPRQ